MACPNCGSDNVRQCDAFESTADDERLKEYNATHGRSGDPIIAASDLAFKGIKAALSTAYRCRNCQHEWRKWF